MGTGRRGRVRRHGQPEGLCGWGGDRVWGWGKGRTRGGVGSGFSLYFEKKEKD